MQNRPSDPILVPEVVEASSELFPAAMEPFELLDKDLLSNFDLDSISAWFSSRLASASQKHGRNLFLATFIKCMEGSSSDGKLFISAICAAETRRSEEYKVKLLLKGVPHSPSIAQATCECAAGEGWSAACKHVAAVCYTVEHYRGTGVLLQLTSKTQQQQTWHRPPKGRQASHMTAAQLAKGACQDVPIQRQLTMNEVVMAAINSRLSPSLLTLTSPCNLQAFCIEHAYGKDPLPVVLVNAINFVTPQTAADIERKTVGQSTSPKWWSVRSTRLTASHFKSMCSTVRSGKLSANPALCILRPKVLKNAAIAWGKKHEKDALEGYASLMHCRVKSVGVFIDKDHSYLAASPDGIADGVLVEVKCPYSVRSKAPTEAYFMEKRGGQYRLKRNHPYYYQVQGQMMVCHAQYTDFVVWTNRGLFIECIKKDEQFCAVMLSQLEQYYKTVFCNEAIKCLPLMRL